MGFVIIDLEFNNLREITKYIPSFYQEYTQLGNTIIENEIIEIGAVKLDRYMNKIDELKLYIKPAIFKILNPKIASMTGITQESINRGVEFSEAMNVFKDFVGEQDIICTWSKNDIVEIIVNAKYHKYDQIDWLNEYLDIQEYCTGVLAHKKSISLKNALQELKIKVEDNNKLHDALNDAEYTSKVFKRVYNPRVVKNHIINDIYNMPAVTIKNLKELSLDYNKINMNCPRCKNKMNTDNALRLISWRFMGTDYCEKCKSKVLHEVIVKRTLSGDEIYSEIKTLLNEVEYMNYCYKLKKAVK